MLVVVQRETEVPSAFFFFPERVMGSPCILANNLLNKTNRALMLAALSAVAEDIKAALSLSMVNTQQLLTHY